MPNFAPDKIVLTGRPDPEQAQRVRESLTQPFIEQYEHNTGFDGRQLISDFSDSRFRFTEVERSIRESVGQQPQRVREAITMSQMASTVGLVVVHTIFEDYAAWPAIYRDLAEIEGSNGEDEVYPEEWADDMPVATAEGEPAPSTRASSAAVRIRNYEYTRELEISKKLFDRDKVGQAKRLARNFGKKYPQAIDKAFIFGLFRAGQLTNLTTAGGIVPKFNIAGQYTQTGFAPTAGAVTPQRIEDGIAATAWFVDPYNVEIVVEFDTIVCDSFDFPKVKRFMTSDKLAVIQSAADGADSTGQAPGGMTDNPLKGALQIAKSPYVKKARGPLGSGGFPWVLMQAKRGAVVQIVHELEVEQENPNSGQSHDTRTYRWQGVLEFGTGVRNGRVFFWGN